MRIICFILIFLFSTPNVFASGSVSDLPKHNWSFEGLTGTFDKSAVQRGFKVYREVCSGCHSMSLLYYRDLIDIGFSIEEVKAIAAEFTFLDGPNEVGEMFERSARP